MRKMLDNIIGGAEHAIEAGGGFMMIPCVAWVLVGWPLYILREVLGGEQ